jgi:hypothetical protein
MILHFYKDSIPYILSGGCSSSKKELRIDVENNLIGFFSVKGKFYEIVIDTDTLMMKFEYTFKQFKFKYICTFFFI